MSFMKTEANIKNNFEDVKFQIESFKSQVKEYEKEQENNKIIANFFTK